MDIKFDMDISGLLNRANLTPKNIAYAVVNAINDTAISFQDKAKANLRARFTIRNAGLEKIAAIIKPFASVAQSRVFADVSVGQRPKLLLGEFEKGGIKAPAVGANVAVPLTGSAARPGFPAPVTPNLRITALGLKQGITAKQRKERLNIKGENRKATSAARREFTKQIGAGKTWKGNQRTYLIPGRGIFQRTGGSGQGKHAGGSSSRLIYRFMAAPVLKPTLHFVELAQTDGAAALRRNLEGRINQELRKKL
jgi:hypothetical protein